MKITWKDIIIGRKGFLDKTTKIQVHNKYKKSTRNFFDLLIFYEEGDSYILHNYTNVDLQRLDFKLTEYNEDFEKLIKEDK